MKLKRILSGVLAAAVAVSSMTLPAFSVSAASGGPTDPIDYAALFTYSDQGDSYMVTALTDNYQDILNGTTEIILPDAYNGKVCDSINASIFNGNNYFTKVTLPSTYKATNTALFKNCVTLKEVAFENVETFRISTTTFSGCTSLEKLYIYANSLESPTNKTVFTNVPVTAVAYVKNDTVKEQLTNWPGTIVVDPSLGGGDTVNYTSLDAAIADAESIDTTKYTEDSVKTLTDAITAGKSVKENADAVQEDVDAATKAITDAIAGLVEASSSVTEYLWTGTFTRKVGVETTSITDGMTVKNNSGNYMTFSGVDLSEMTTPTVEILYTGDSDTVFISTSSWAEIGKGTSTADTVFTIPDSYKSTTSFIVTTNNQSAPYGTITSVRFYDAAVSQKTAVATYEVGAENASDVIATLYDDGSMVISGTGAMVDYSSSASKSAPWNQDGNISKITSIEVQNGVTTIGKYAFRNCTTVTSITLAESVTSILNAAFYGCNNENLVVDIKGTVTNAASLCFSNVVGTNSTTYANVSKRASAAKLEYLGEMPPLSGKIGENATYTYDADTKTMTVSGTGALYSRDEAPDLMFFADAEKIVIEEGITSVGASLFENYNEVTSIIIPSTVSELNTDSFTSSNSNLIVELKSESLTCQYLSLSLNVRGTVIVYSTSVFETYFADQFTAYTVIFAGEGPTTGNFSYESGESSNINWSYDKETKTITVTGTGEIPDWAKNAAITYYKNEIKRVIYEKGVTNVGRASARKSWGDCTVLESVKLADTVKVISDSSFSANSSIKYIEILSEDEVTFGENVFAYNKGLEKLVIHSASIKSSSSYTLGGPAGATAYVISEQAKSDLESIGWSGKIVVDPNMKTVDKTSLQSKISEADTYIAGVNKDLCNEEQLANIELLEKAIASAKTANESTDATQLDVDIELNNLTLAYNNATGYVKTAAIFTISCKDCNYNDGGLKPEAQITQGDGVVDYKLYTDESCEIEFSGYSYNSPYLPIGTYYIKGIMRETVNYASAESSNVVRVEVTRNYINDKDLLAAIEDAETFYEENESMSSDYNGVAWNNVYGKTGTLAKANTIKNDTEGLYPQSKVDEAKDNLITTLNHLRTAYADTTEIRAELLSVIETAEAITNIYSDESWKAFQDALAYAKEIYANENEFKSVYTNAKDMLFSAIENLTTEEAGEPFIKIYKSAVEAVLAELTANEAIDSAVKIKVTFDCANDVNFNKNASIELKATVGAKENWNKFYGLDETSANGQIGCIIELPLTNAIAEGDKVKLTAYTYAWNGAADYVYAVTKVEFFDAEGHALYAITDRTIAYDALQADIAKAEKIEQGDYTDESFAVLQTAIRTAKLVEDNAEKAVIDEAREALSKAIEGLTTEPIIVTGTVSGTIKVSDANSKTEMTVIATSSDGTETTVTATSMGTYTLENLEAGSYTLTISGGKYAERSYEITVTEGENTQDVELNPYGDINGDGKITTADVGMANSHAKGVITLTDYGFACADVKTDGSITTADVGMINSHAKSVSTLW